MPDGFTRRPTRGTYRGTFDVPREEAEAQAAHAASLGLTPTAYRRAALRAYRGAPVESVCVPLDRVPSDVLRAALDDRGER